MVRLLRTHEENMQVLQSESKVWSIIMSTYIHVCTYGRGVVSKCRSLFNCESIIVLLHCSLPQSSVDYLCKSKLKCML